MFGQIVYTLHKVLAAVDSLGYDELFIHINLGNDEIPVAYSNGLFIQVGQFHVLVNKYFAEIITVIPQANVAFAIHLPQSLACIVFRFP